MGDSDTWVYMQFGPDPSDHSVWERYVSAMVRLWVTHHV